MSVSAVIGIAALVVGAVFAYLYIKRLALPGMGDKEE